MKQHPPICIPCALVWIGGPILSLLGLVLIFSSLWR